MIARADADTIGKLLLKEMEILSAASVHPIAVVSDNAAAMLKAQSTLRKITNPSDEVELEPDAEDFSLKSTKSQTKTWRTQWFLLTLTKTPLQRKCAEVGGLS